MALVASGASLPPFTRPALRGEWDFPRLKTVRGPLLFALDPGAVVTIVGPLVIRTSRKPGGGTGVTAELSAMLSEDALSPLLLLLRLIIRVAGDWRAVGGLDDIVSGYVETYAGPT